MASADIQGGNLTGNDEMKTSILGQDASLVCSQQGQSQDFKNTEVESSGYKQIPLCVTFHYKLH